MSITPSVRPTTPDLSTPGSRQAHAGSRLAAMLDTLHLWLVRRWQRDELRQRIDDKRLLEDIGLRREQVLREVNKDVWQ